LKWLTGLPAILVKNRRLPCFLAKDNFFSVMEELYQRVKTKNREVVGRNTAVSARNESGNLSSQLQISFKASQVPAQRFVLSRLLPESEASLLNRATPPS